MWLKTAGACLALALAPNAASAQDGDPASYIARALAQDELARCLVEHHDPAIEDAFRAFLIAALEERRVQAQTAALSLGMRIARSGMTDCGLDLRAMQSADAQASFQLYSGWVGERIMADAVGDLGFM